MNENEHEHGPDCNCEDCWWSHDQEVVDEFGVPVPNDEDDRCNQ